MSVDTITEARQYLTFRLDTEIYAMDVGQVREILEFSSVTKVPQTHDFMRGVINLRGKVVPVVDMRLKFGLSETVKTVNTCIVVTEVNFDSESMILGALVDSVQEVIELEPDQIEPAPRMGSRLKTDFIKGIGKLEDRFIIILDVDRVFSADELLSLQEAETVSE